MGYFTHVKWLIVIFSLGNIEISSGIQPPLRSLVEEKSLISKTDTTDTTIGNLNGAVSVSPTATKKLYKRDIPSGYYQNYRKKGKREPLGKKGSSSVSVAAGPHGASVSAAASKQKPPKTVPRKSYIKRTGRKQKKKLMRAASVSVAASPNGASAASSASRRNVTRSDWKKKKYTKKATPLREKYPKRQKPVGGIKKNSASTPVASKPKPTALGKPKEKGKTPGPIRGKNNNVRMPQIPWKPKGAKRSSSVAVAASPHGASVGASASRRMAKKHLKGKNIWRAKAIKKGSAVSVAAGPNAASSSAAASRGNNRAPKTKLEKNIGKGKFDKKKKRAGKKVGSASISVATNDDGIFREVSFPVRREVWQRY